MFCFGTNDTSVGHTCSAQRSIPIASIQCLLRRSGYLPSLLFRHRIQLRGLVMSDEASTTRFVRRFYLLALLGSVVGSGLPGHAAAQSRFFTFELNIDRPGRDYNNTPSRGASDCSFACQADNRCRAWTYVRPGVQGPSGRCWLKNAVPGAVRNNCCTSGVRKGAPRPID